RFVCSIRLRPLVFELYLKQGRRGSLPAKLPTTSRHCKEIGPSECFRLSAAGQALPPHHKQVVGFFFWFAVRIELPKREMPAITRARFVPTLMCLRQNLKERSMRNCLMKSVLALVSLMLVMVPAPVKAQTSDIGLSVYTSPTTVNRGQSFGVFALV